MKSKTKKFILGVIILLFISNSTFAQNKWSLEECIDHARENSLVILQARANSRLADINRTALQEVRYPSLNFSTNYGLRFGRTIDPTTNAFETSTLNTNGLSLNTNWLLYNGNRINHLVYQSKLDLEATRKDQEQISNDLALEISSLYLTILLAKENLSVAENNLALSKNQFEQINILVRNGARAIGEKYEAESQLLLQEQIVINSQNAVMMGLMTLAQLLQIEDFNLFDIEDIDIEIDESALSLALPQIYNSALSTQPQIAAAKLRVQSSQYSSKIARSEYYPTIALFANLNTNYSSLSRQIDRLEPTMSSPTPVIINGELSTVEYFQFSPIFINNPYFNQLEQNFGMGVGIQLNLPIYDNGRIRAGVNRAHVQEQLSEIQSEQIQQQLRNNVERSVADAIAARASYQAALKNIAAAERSFFDVQKRYNSGTSSLFEFNSIQFRYQNAQVESVRAKYDYIFKLKIIDFFSGKSIRF